MVLSTCLDEALQHTLAHSVSHLHTGNRTQLTDDICLGRNTAACGNLVEPFPLCQVVEVFANQTTIVVVPES
jgi:hypothetical protein